LDWVGAIKSDRSRELNRAKISLLLNDGSRAPRVRSAQANSSEQQNMGKITLESFSRSRGIYVHDALESAFPNDRNMQFAHRLEPTKPYRQLRLLRRGRSNPSGHGLQNDFNSAASRRGDRIKAAGHHRCV
jgi:hypothetical protein